MIIRLLIEILKELYKIRRLLETQYRVSINEPNAEKHIVAIWNRVATEEYESVYNNKYKRGVKEDEV